MRVLKGSLAAVSACWCLSGFPTPAAYASTKVESSVNIIAIKMLNAEHGWSLGVKRGSPIVLHTDDGGHQWNPVSPVGILQNISRTTSLAFAAINNTTCWIGEENHNRVTVIYTKNVAHSWGKRAFVIPMNVASVTLDFTDANRGWLFATGSPDLGMMSKFLYATPDGALSWHVISTSSHLFSNGLPASGYPTGLMFSGSRDGWITLLSRTSPSEVAVYHSNDGGSLWHKENIRPPKSLPTQQTYYYNVLAPESFRKKPNSAIFLLQAVGPQTGICVYHATDNSNSWRATATAFIPTKNGVVVDSFTDENHGWVAGANNRLYTTADGGLHWSDTQSNVPLSRCTALDFVSANVGWGILGGHLYKSADKGVTWNRQL